MVNSQLLNTVTVISLAFCLSCALQLLDKHEALKTATITCMKSLERIVIAALINIIITHTCIFVFY